MGQYDWWVSCGTAVDNDYSDTQAKVVVTAYFVNNGWNYQIAIKSWCRCGNSGWTNTGATGIDTTGVSVDGGKTYAGSVAYYPNKTKSSQTLQCDTCIKDASGNSYAGGYERYSSKVNVTINPLASYSISYNKNSTYNSYVDSTVSNLPSSQTKWYGEDLTLSSTIPTKASTTKNGYTVTLNYNYSGSTSSTLTAVDTYNYTFSKWNTSSNGSGTNYNAGSSYTTNSANTLYAIWNREKVLGSVTLPEPERSGFTFLGWATTSSASTGSYNGGDVYTPSNSIVLYAIWRANLNNNYVLKATSRSQTWESLINAQNTSGSTLYEAGGQYNGWGIDSSGYVTCFGVRIETGNGPVQKTDKPIRGETYYYYE